MIILTIFNPDGNTIWVENFNNMEDCGVWIEQEQKRPYWNPLNTYSIQDKRPTQAELAQQEAELLANEAAQKALKQSAKAKLKALGLTDDEVFALIGV